MINDTLITDRVYVCPSCGSATVDASTLVGGEGSCRSCGWRGPVADLLAVPVQHAMGSPEEIKRQFYAEVKDVFSKDYAFPLLKILLRWGFLPPAPSAGSPPLATKVYARKLGRYMLAIANASARAIFETRDAIARENSQPKKGDPNVS